MNENDVYKKIPWVKNIPEIFEGNFMSLKRLDSFPEKTQKYLVYKSMLTLSQYFSQIPDYDSGDKQSIVESLENTLPTWLSGLCDLSVSQIINGLLDVLNLKTEYQKFPPKSVMQFYTVCKTFKPAYHDQKKESSFKLNSNELIKKSDEVAKIALSNIFKMLGKDYEKIRMGKEKILASN